MSQPYERIAIPIFPEQVVTATTYYTDIVSMSEYSMLNLHITSSGTVDGAFTLQTRSRPAPEIGIWTDQDDGYWYDELGTESIIIGADGSSDKQTDSVHLDNVDSAQLRLKMVITVGGTLNVHATIK